MRSAWERITNGQYSASNTEEPRRGKTARQIKDEFRSTIKDNTARAERKFDKLQALNDAKASAKERRKVSDSWINRTKTDTRGFFDAKAARAAKRAAG